MAIAEALVQELDYEGGTTRRVLERVPSDKLAWKPHAKSMSLGELAFHVASTPGLISTWALSDAVDFGNMPRPEPATSTAEICAVHDESMTKAKSAATQLGDAGLMGEWAGKM